MYCVKEIKAIQIKLNKLLFIMLISFVAITEVMAVYFTMCLRRSFINLVFKEK